jgi:hypothetical protein
MGVKTYSTAWNGPKYWYQQGYAANAGGTLYPYIQGPFSIVNEFPEGFGDILGKHTTLPTSRSSANDY